MDNGKEILIAAIVIVIIMMCAIGGWCGFMKYRKHDHRKPSKEPYDKVSDEHEQDDVEMVESPDVEAGATKLTTDTTYEVGLGGEEESFVTDNADEKRCDLLQWFQANVGLAEDENLKYCDMFIQNGYDVVSAFRYIDRSELIMIGIQRRGHQKLILDAIKKYNNSEASKM
eukprot:CAMPEP_0197047026 /NCGR_PEP_ID=MMETSP1384-20130603/22588_1 /TAXON_ID=29189 /ORGANISM="Ammonia sp." /LENGTH=170 /DNA_ID=CAMNT_0042478883 /DNA_START=34 /DNA_END=546 /DNA_ORIENTATION=-